MKKNFLIFIILLANLSSCNITNKNNRLGTDALTMQYGQEKFMSLDSMTTQETGYIQYLNDGRIAFYNLPAHNICVFDVEKGEEVEKIQLYKEGPNSVRGIQGLYYDSADSIWLYQSWEKNLVLVNNKGIIVDKRNLQDKIAQSSLKNRLSVEPFPLTDMPIRKVDDLFVLQGFNGPEVVNGFRPACSVFYDLKADTVSVANEYPSIYGEPSKMNDNWGTFSYRAIPYTLNEYKMVLSFPASDDIYVYDLKSGKKESYFAGTSLETDISSIEGVQKSQLEKHYLEQLQYAGIFYDKYNDLYYRLAVLPIFDYDIHDKQTQQKPLAVIILNSNFEKVGEFNLGIGRYKYRNVFVSKEGLHLNVYSEDDDYLKFITLKVLKNEK